MEVTNHKSLLNYLRFVENQYNIKICINDFTGFIPLDKDLDKIMQNFFAHTNDYCMYVKSDLNLMRKCQNMKKGIFRKSIKLKKPFYGVCHAGVGELIYPIFHGDKLLGVLNIGVFKNNNIVNHYLINKACNHSILNYDKALELYNSSLSEFKVEESNINTVLAFICDYISLSFGKLSIDYHTENLLKKMHNSSEDFILSHCIQFIKSNFRNEIDVKVLRGVCHCSESYINHIFKKRTGKNIKQYANTIRINESMELLTKSEKSISEISSIVGFKDPDYFSRVFSKIIGISPKKYRERFSHNVILSS